MATDFYTPRLSDQQQSAFYQAQAQQLPQQPPLPTFPQPQPYTPQISPLSTSGNASPTSPKHYVTRPMRPLFMPAVLRPTRFPPKPATPKSRPESDDEEDERTLKSNSSFINLSGALSRLSRRSTGDSGKCVDDDWNLDLFAEPTGAPTRGHWKPDYESTICDHATCRRTFSYFTRRHHCRKCGNIFCDTHSSHEIPLDQDANYNPRAVQSRACEHCYSQFREWRSRTNSQSSGDLPENNNTNHNNNPGDYHGQLPPTPIAASPTTPLAGKTMPELALSVPRDWNWSTF